jgi:hypothetical protein
MDDFSLDEIYKAFRREVESRGLHGPVLERSGDGETEYELFAYTYEPQADDELDFQLAVESTGIYNLTIGPIEETVEMGAVDRSIVDWAAQLADIAQMTLNGQFAVLITERDGDNAWQAAELVWTDENGKYQVVGTMSNHERSHDELHARTLQNHEKYPNIYLPLDHTAHPPKINGEYPYARTVDLKHPEPLTKKEFNHILNTQPVQFMGGNAGTSIWNVFYRRIEFWIVAVAVLAMYVYITDRWMGDDSLFSMLAQSVLGLIGVFCVTFISTYLLTKRQMLLDAGGTPLGERVERVLFSSKAPGFMVAGIAATMYLAPIWSPNNDIHHLYTAMQLPDLLMIPVTIASLLYMAAFYAIKRSGKIKKLLRALLFASGLGLSIYTDTVICYGGDDAAMADWWWIVVVAGLPIFILLGLITDIFMSDKKRQ